MKHRQIAGSPGPGGDALSASAQGTDSQTPSCVSDALLADARAATTETWRTSPGHVERWSRVLAAFGVSNAYSGNPMTVAEAQAQADRGLKRWKPVAPALECLAAAPEEEAQSAQAEAQPVTPATPELSLRAGSAVDEGGNATFTVTADPAPATDLTIAWTIAQSGDFAASGETGSRTVTVPVTGSATFEVATDDDSTDEPDGSITATLGTGTGYTVAAAPDHAATVAVSDNDAAASGPTISIVDATMKENQRNGYFTVTLSEKVDWPVHVYYATRDSTPVSAVAGQDYLAWKRSWQLRARFRPGETETLIHVVLYNDSHDEDPETFEMVLFDAGVNGPPGVSVSIADGVAVGTITNSDPMPAAWLARFGRTAAEQALDGIAGRIAASRSAGVEGTIAGQSLGFGSSDGSGAANDNPGPGSPSGNDLLAQSSVARAFGASADGWGAGAIGHDALATGSQPPVSGSYTMTGLEVLLGSSFTATAEKDATGGSLALWGRAAQSSFDGREGTFSLDGEATTAMLGADYARGHRRWQAEAAWGFPAFSGRFTGSPHVGLGLATGARDYSVGWRLTPVRSTGQAPDLSFGVRATRREGEWAPLEHTVGFEVIARW